MTVLTSSRLCLRTMSRKPLSLLFCSISFAPIREHLYCTHSLCNQVNYHFDEWLDLVRLVALFTTKPRKHRLFLLDIHFLFGHLRDYTIFQTFTRTKKGERKEKIQC